MAVEDAQGATEGLPAGAADNLEEALTELQRLKSAVVDGAAANASIAVTGIGASDHIVKVTRFDVGADTGTSATGDKVQGVTDVTAEATVFSAGNIRLSTTNTTGDRLEVMWFDKS